MSRLLLGLALVLVWLVALACDTGAPPMTCQPWGDSAALAERPSPYDSVTFAQGHELVAKLCYSRPYARGRVVFGGLVPYDTLWRTGANEPTIIHLSRPAEIAGLRVDAGDYSLYTVPSESRWTLVVNASTSQWGLTREERGAQGNLFPNAYTDEVRAQEVGRAPIEIEPIDPVEQLTARFVGTPPDVQLLFEWEGARIVVPIRLLENPQ